MEGLPVNSNERLTARKTAEMWFDKIQRRVLPRVEFARMVITSTLRWRMVEQAKKSTRYFPYGTTPYTRAINHITAPYRRLKNFVREREVEALASLWDLGWKQPEYRPREEVIIRTVDDPRFVAKVILTRFGRSEKVATAVGTPEPPPDAPDGTPGQ